jgi:hypothetical protein
MHPEQATARANIDKNRFIAAPKSADPLREYGAGARVRQAAHDQLQSLGRPGHVAALVNLRQQRLALRLGRLVRLRGD